MHPAERARQAELRELAALMRERVGLAPALVPVPLHKMGAMRATITDVRPEQPGGSEKGTNMPDVGDRVARRTELGTVVGLSPDKPDWFEGDWPESPPRGSRGMAIIKWPGRKKLTVEPVGNLITVNL